MSVAGHEPGYESDPNDDSPFANPLGAATRTFDATAKPAGLSLPGLGLSRID